MRHILFATGGHVDHGKTTLIKTITGKDTDRLPEEKKRGLSIDIGFAYIDFPEKGICAEIIDLPGHERFIKNAIAGMAGARALILVIDALEGIKQQTEEHLVIARSLGIQRIIAVVTKIDKADRNLIEKRKSEIRNFLNKNELDPVVLEFSPFTEESHKAIVSAIGKVASILEPHPLEGPLRIHIDSAFTVRGFGTVVRGTMVSGTLKEGERIVIEPVSIKGRVRKIQNHGKFIEKAFAGQRVALNIPEVEPDKIERGFWILREGEYSKSTNLIIKSDVPLKKGGIYSAFIGMGEVRGRIREPGKGIYLFRCEGEVVAFRGDRILILNSQGRPIGGADVLHPSPRNFKKEFIARNLDDLLNNFESYLQREKPAVEKTVKIEDLPDRKSVEKLLKLTSEKIWEERDLLQEGVTKDTIRHCVKKRMVHRLGTSLIISDGLLKDYIETLQKAGETLDVRKAKEALGLTRKYVIPLLEYLDYLGLTLRKGNSRIWKGRG